jgi:hypothetical protein
LATSTVATTASEMALEETTYFRKIPQYAELPVCQHR